MFKEKLDKAMGKAIEFILVSGKVKYCTLVLWISMGILLHIAIGGN